VRSLSDALARFDRLVEVGVGDRTDLAAALAAAGSEVVARAGAVERARREGRAPDLGPYVGADALYGRRLPPELQPPTVTVARAVGAPLLFTTLGGDPVVVEATPETVAEGTLYRAE